MSPLLRLFVASVLANAVLGTWALLSGDFGETEGKVLATSFLASASMLSVLVNLPAIRRRVLWPAPLVGAAIGGLALATVIVLVWAEPRGDHWFKLVGSLLVAAGGCTLASSLAMVTLTGRLRWLQPFADGLIALLALTIIVGLWAEPDVDWYARVVGIESVVVAALTLLIPALGRFSALDTPTVDTGAGSRTVKIRFCPSCGHVISANKTGTAMSTVCGACGLEFDVQLAAGNCAGVGTFASASLDRTDPTVIEAAEAIGAPTERT